MKAKVLGLFVAAACGSTETNGQPGSDASQSTGSDGGSGSGSGSGSGGGTVTDLTCVTQTSIVTLADNSRTESRSHFLLIDGVGPHDDVLVEQCNLTITGPIQPAPTQSCPAGATCSTTGTADPGAVCYWQRPTSFTAAGKLWAYCGNGAKVVNSGGTTTLDYDQKYGVNRLHRY